MKRRIRNSLARGLALLAAPLLALGVMAGTAPASTAVTAGYPRQAVLAAADGAANDTFGYSVALSASGTTALVGAWQHNSDTGAAYVFRLRGRTWVQTAELTAADGAANDDFGYSVALSASGTTALIGASRHAGTGAAYVYRLQGRTWARSAELTAAHGTTGDGFGGAVALSASGSTALIGASGQNTITGAAYVFRLRGRAWAQTAELTATDGASFDVFGSAVALSASGGTALIGAAGHNSNTGAAYVFRLRGSTWSRTAELTAAHAAAGDDFGISVSLSAAGSTALAGAPGRTTETGAAYVFRLHGGSWSQSAALTATGGAVRDQFGYAVALSAQGDTALSGAPYRNEATGAAYVFRRHGRTWSQSAALTASGGASSDQLGYSVALSAPGGTVLAGAIGRNSSAGAAYVFSGRGR